MPEDGAVEMDTLRAWEAAGHSGRGKMVTVVVGSPQPVRTPRAAFSPPIEKVNAEHENQVWQAPKPSPFSLGKHRVNDGAPPSPHARFVDGVEGAATLQVEDVESPQLSRRRCVRGDVCSGI